MTTELIHVELLDNGISTTDEAQVIASNLHNELAEIKIVDSPSSQSVATERAVNAQSFLKRLEKSRKDVKAPILEFGRKIDALAEELAAPVTAEMKRVGSLVAKFQTAEAIRVERERAEREKREREAMEAARLAAEAERKAAEAMKDEATLAAAVKAEADAKQKEAEMYQTLTAPAPAPVKASGSVTKKVLRWEVTDIHALYKAAPHLVKLEPNVMAIKSTCTATQNIAGLRLWEELDTNFRSR
jgi:hypothetical protein